MIQVAQAAMEMSWGWDRGNQGTWRMGPGTEDCRGRGGECEGGSVCGLVSGGQDGAAAVARLGLEKQLVKSRSINRTKSSGFSFYPISPKARYPR